MCKGIVRADCSNGLVFEELNGLRLGDIYEYDPHRFSSVYKQYKIIYLYKAQQANFAQIIYDDGFVDFHADLPTIKKDKFIKHTNFDWKSKIIDYSDLKQRSKTNDR